MPLTRPATWLACLALAAPAAAQENAAPSCGSADVIEPMRELFAESLCFDPAVMLRDLMVKIKVVSGGVTLDRIMTTAAEETPPTRTCEARLKFDVVITALAIGPSVQSYKLSMAGYADAVSYRVGRYDEGEIYVRIVPPPTPPGFAPSPPPCWKVETMENLGAPVAAP